MWKLWYCVYKHFVCALLLVTIMGINKLVIISGINKLLMDDLCRCCRVFVIEIRLNGFLVQTRVKVYRISLHKSSGKNNYFSRCLN